MKKFIRRLRRMYSSFGLVEQSQIVASTAVVVAMVTIVSAHFLLNEKLQWLDFVSILTVGIIGYVSVYFSLKYGRQLEEQRHELQVLNSVAEAVNHSVELEYVLQSSLQKVVEVLGSDFGWIYLTESQWLVLKHRYGTTTNFFPHQTSIDDVNTGWIQKPYHWPSGNDLSPIHSLTLDEEGLRSWVSIPLERKGQFAGVLILGRKESEPFEGKPLSLLQTFGNQINVALQNASLFEQVRQSEQLYADLYEHTPDMYHSVNRDGIVVGCNITESVLLGYSKEEIIGKPLSKLYPAEQVGNVQENLRHLFALAEELRGVEEQMRSKRGELIDVSVNTSLVYDSEGKPVLARMVARDITEKKRLEEQIRHAQKIDSIGNLAGGIAHDFNNILSSILGSASMMRRKLKPDDPWYSYIDMMETASRRGAALTRQLLTFARKGNVHVRPLDLNDVVRETLRLFEPSIPKTIHVEKELSPGFVVVSGDEGQLQQALLNLCINARDAMAEGGSLTIKTHAIELSSIEAARVANATVGPYATISVIDTGAGMSADVQARVFEPFFTTKERGKGTGLGLSVVYGVVRGHGGSVAVESAVGVGTKITLYFPRIPEDRLARGKKGAKHIPRGREHILLVDDELSVGVVGSAMLRDLGYSVETVHNGAEAIEIIKDSRNKFSLIILDMNMPRLGGKETFRRIKQHLPAVKILISSGYSDAMLEDDNFMNEVDGFLQKPYAIDEIAYKVREVLDQNGSFSLRE